MIEAEGELRIQVLGPVRAWSGETELGLGSAHRRAVLAVLALSAGHPVSRHELIDSVWGDAPPASANGSIYTYVSGLRRILDPKLTPRSGEGVLASTGPGYTLRLPREQVDAHEFEVRRAAANQRRTAGDLAGAVAELDAALALYRDEPLAGLTGPYAHTQRTRLTELRLTVVENRAELQLDLHRYDEVVAELSALCQEHPQREKPAALLMRALHESGRRDEALEVYATTAANLQELSGIDPGSELRRVRDQVRGARPAPVLRPARPELFVGREAELKLLRTSMDAVLAGQGGLLWIEGMAGIGKSALLGEALSDTTAELRWTAAQEFSDRALQECIGAAQAMEEAARLCAQGPLIVAMDNFQWADEATVQFWNELARLTEELPLLLIAAGHSVPWRTGHGQLLQLDPLTTADSILVARQKLADPLALRERRAVEGAAGHPGFLGAVVTDLVGSGAVEHPSPRLASWMNDQLSFLSPPARSLLQRAAVLGTSFTTAELAATSPQVAEPLIAEAERAGVLSTGGENVRFRQPVVRSALYTHTPQAMRVALHHEFADRLARSGAHAVRVAEQLAAALPTVASWTQEWLPEHIGAVAVEQPATAIQLLRSGPPRPDAQVPLTAMLARLLFWQGWDPRPEASAVLLRTDDPDLTAEMRWILAYVNHRLGRIEEALGQVAEAMNDERVDERWLSRHQLLLERLADEPRAWHLTQALAWGDVRPHSGAPAIAGFQFLDEQTASELGTADSLDAAAVWRMAPYRAIPGDLHRLLSGQHYWSGNWAGAVAEAEVLLSSDSARPSYLSPDSGGFSHGSIALIETHRGSWDAAEAHEYLAADTYARYGDSHQVLLMTQSMRAERSGQLQEAIDILWSAVTGGAPWSRWLPRVTSLATWSSNDGQVARVRTLLDSQPSARLSAEQEAVREHCTGLIVASPSCVHAAAQRFDDLPGLTLLAIHATADFAWLLAREGRVAEAHNAFYDAVRRYRAIGAITDVGRLTARLHTGVDSANLR